MVTPHAVAARMAGRFRAVFLLLIGLMQIVYGAGLLEASGHHPSALHWWPGAVTSLAGVPLRGWGLIWITVGIILAVTCWMRLDRWQFVLAAALNATWACLAVQRWLMTREPGAWAPAAIYITIAVSVLLIAIWPDPPVPRPEV